MTTEIVKALCVLNTVEAITQANITVGDSLGWVILLVSPDERVCSSFEGYSILLYECLFIKLGVRPPFSNFEVAIMNH